MFVVRDQICSGKAEDYSINGIKNIYFDVLLNIYMIQLYDFKRGRGPQPLKPDIPDIDSFLLDIDDTLLQFINSIGMQTMLQLKQFCEQRIERDTLLDQITLQLDSIFSQK